jgi:hypothetical protein
METQYRLISPLKYRFDFLMIIQGDHNPLDPYKKIPYVIFLCKSHIGNKPGPISFYRKISI